MLQNRKDNTSSYSVDQFLPAAPLLKRWSHPNNYDWCGYSSNVLMGKSSYFKGIFYWDFEG